MSWLTKIDFTHPWFGLLILVPALYGLYHMIFVKRSAALIFSNIHLMRIPGSWRYNSRFVPGIFFLIAWTLLTIAMMGPRMGYKETQVTTEGIAIAMVMDVSGSMAQKDMPKDKDLISRLRMVEKVFRDFVRGKAKDELEGRENDMIGLVTFDRFVQEMSPLTLDHDFIMDLMQDTVESVLAESERLNRSRSRQHHQSSSLNGTAVYEGVALGADMLRKSEQSLEKAIKKGEGRYQIKSKVMIVLTDGQDNASDISATDAVKVAKEFGVKIYTIAVHGKPVTRDIFGVLLRSGGQQFDDSPLRKMAKETGGRFFKATNPESLTRIYEEIDNLETTEISKQVTMEYEPAHHEWVFWGFMAIIGGLVLQNSLYRVLP